MRNRREPRPRRPCEAPPTQAACQRGGRGPARRMESSPAPGSLWFLSPAGKELVRPQTHETPSSHTLIFGCVPPPLISPKPNPPSLPYLSFHFPLHSEKRFFSPRSRRDHNPLAGKRTHLSGGTTSAEAALPNASRSSGEGVWGERRFSQRSGLSPRISHPSNLFGREREGGASRREAASLAYPILSTCTLVQVDGA